MRAIYRPQFQADLNWWRVRSEATLREILRLVRATMEHPRYGPGEPRLVKKLGRGVWARHIQDDHFLIYFVKRNEVVFRSCRAIEG